MDKALRLCGEFKVMVPMRVVLSRFHCTNASSFSMAVVVVGEEEEEEEAEEEEEEGEEVEEVETNVVEAKVRRQRSPPQRRTDGWGRMA